MVVTQSILSFLLSILISLGGTVTADNIGQDFTTICSNQDPSVQFKINRYLVNPGGQLLDDITLEGFKLTAEIYNDIQDGKVTNQVIQNTIGSAEWGQFIANNKNNIISNNNKFNFADGSYCEFEFVPYAPSTGVPSLGINDGRSWSLYRCWIYKYNFEGIKIDSWNNTFLLSVPQTGYNVPICSPEGSSPIWDVEIIDAESGKFTFKRYGYQGAVVQSEIYTCPLLAESQNSRLDDCIGTITDVAISGAAIGTLPIAADGSITLPDGSRVFPNADGTYTIGGTTYSPVYNLEAYDDSALLGLLEQLLQKIDSLENQLEFEKEIDTPADYDKAFENVQAYQGTMNEFIYSSPKWTTVFPFCIPWDFVRGVKLLSAAPVAPRFDIPFEIPAFGAFKGYSTTISLDFSEYEKYFQPVRWFTTMFFLIGLGFVTFKIVKGAA